MSTRGLGSFSRSKRLAILVFALCVILLASAYAYWQVSRPLIGPRATITSFPFEFSIQLDKTEYQHSEDHFLIENVTVTLSLKNIGNETTTLYWGDASWGRRYYDFQILDENGSKVFLWTGAFAKMELDESITLQPGGQLTQVYPWDTRTYPYNAFAPKGHYFVKGLTRRFAVMGNQTQIISLETPTVAFMIV